MSFDVNVLSSKPIIKAASSMNNDGGSGGNLGYMSQGRKKKEQEKRYLDSNIFMKHTEEDVFGFNKEPELPEEKNILGKITKIFKK